MATKNSPAKRGKNEVAAFDYGDHAGQGFQNQTQDDIKIPFLNVLQKGSAIVDEREDAKAGMLYNTVTEELSEVEHFVPCLTQHVYVEWVPRDAGGGIVGQHDPKSDVVRKAKSESTQFGKYRTPDGNDLVETFYVYGVLVDPEDRHVLSWAVLAMSSTKIGVYKKAMTRLNTFQTTLEDGRRINPPLYAHLLRLSTTLERRSKGDSYNFVIQPAVENDVQKSLLDPESDTFKTAAELMELIDSGKARADTESVTQDRQSDEEPDEDDPF